MPTLLISSYSARHTLQLWRSTTIITITAMTFTVTWFKASAATEIITMADFLLYALIAGIAVALVSGPLGAFVVWRRMAYFGDTLAHSALLGISLGVLMDINLSLAVVLCCVGLALALVAMQRQHWIANDTLLGIMAHSALSLGLVTISLLDNVRLDLQAYLFGDLLAITPEDLRWILIGAVIVLGLVYWLWKPLLAITINEELAQVEGIHVSRYRLILMLLIAMVIAGAMKLVGVLLITSLMIIPAAAARRLSQTPEQMAIFAGLLGTLSVLGGISLSWFIDTPAGPSVVVSALVIFMLIFLAPRARA